MSVTDWRVGWIDVAKGIGIILVILGHTFALSKIFVLYTFHMPLFFLISGLLAKTRISFYDTILKASKSILRPWLIFFLISLCVVCLIPSWRNQLSWDEIMLDLYTSNTNFIQNSSLWYLVCFFFVLLLFYPLSKCVDRIKTTFVWIPLTIFFVFLLYNKDIICSLPLPDNRLPFKIDSAVIALSFFYLGFYFREKIFELIKKIKGYFFFVFFVVWLFFAKKNGWTNLNSFDFGAYPILFYPTAFCGIMAVCIASFKIASFEKCHVKSVLSFYGRNSLLIFGLQSLFIRLYILIFNEYFGESMQLYGDNPMIHQLSSFLIVTFVISPLFVLSFRKIKSLWLNK